MSSNTPDAQNGVDKLRAEEFPRDCPDCGRYFLSVRAYASHDCGGDDLIVADGGVEVLKDQTGRLEPDGGSEEFDTTPQQLARRARQFARGAADLVEDDELADVAGDAAELLEEIERRTGGDNS